MSQYLVPVGILAISLLAYLTVRNAVAEKRLHDRIARTLALDGRQRFVGGKFRHLLSAGSLFSTVRERERLAIRLQQAGLFHSDAVDVFLIGRMVLPVLLWLAAVVQIAPENTAALATPVAVLKQVAAAFLGARLSEIWLSRRIRIRRLRIRRRVPEALELLTICVSSGLTFEEALKKAADEVAPMAPELANEFLELNSKLVINEDRQAVLERFIRRSSVPELEAVARTVMQSMRYGTPLVDALQTTADQSRLAQLNDIKERAGGASARISVPLILFVVFPVVVLLGAPAFINLARTMKGMGG